MFKEGNLESREDQPSIEQIWKREEWSSTFPTLDLQRVARRIDAFTGSSDEEQRRDVIYKVATVAEIRERQLVDEDILRRYPLVYVGSHADVTYPLALGGRDIILVDPVFDQEASTAEFVDRMLQVVTKDDPTYDAVNRKWNFNFDFGSGDEQVSVQIKGELFCSSEDIARDGGYKKFNLPEEVGMVVSYRHGVDGMPETRIDEDPRTLDSIVPGGYILAFPMMPSFMGSTDEWLDLYRQNPGKLIHKLEKGWKRRGFIPTPLKSSGSFPGLVKKDH